MSSAAAGLPIHSPQLFSFLAGLFIVGLCLAVSLIILFLLFRELAAARVFRGRQLATTDFYARPFPPARETSLEYRRGQFQEGRKSFAR